MAIKIVAVVRHVHEGVGDRLHPESVKDAKRLAEALVAQIPPGSKIAIFSSDVRRVVQTAKILGSRLGITAETRDDLYDVEDSHDGTRVRRWVMEDAADNDVVIIVAHLFAPSCITDAFLKYIGGSGMEKHSVNYGHGYFLSLETGKVSRVP